MNPALPISGQSAERAILGACMRQVHSGWPVLLLLMLASLALSGCAGNSQRSRRIPAATPPTTLAVQGAVSNARVALANTGGRVTSAQGHVEAAKGHAGVLLRATAPDLRPVVVALQNELAAAGADLDAAKARSAELATALDQAEQSGKRLQLQIDAQTASLVTALEEKSAALDEVENLNRAIAVEKTKVRTEAGLKWRWRGYFLLLLLGVAGFFALRQYIPFLKAL